MVPLLCPGDGGDVFETFVTTYTALHGFITRSTIHIFTAKKTAERNIIKFVLVQYIAQV
jgi:hypothetical protein